jgi:hypothetical protein
VGAVVCKAVSWDRCNPFDNRTLSLCVLLQLGHIITWLKEMEADADARGWLKDWSLRGQVSKIHSSCSRPAVRPLPCLLDFLLLSWAAARLHLFGLRVVYGHPHQDAMQLPMSCDM